jgi:hypothetical protein
VDGKDYFQVVFTRPTGETLLSPLLERREAVEWIKWVLNAPSPSSSKAGV